MTLSAGVPDGCFGICVEHNQSGLEAVRSTAASQAKACVRRISLMVKPDS